VHPKRDRRRRRGEEEGVAGDGESEEARQPCDDRVVDTVSETTRQVALGEELLALSSGELEQVLAGLRRLDTRDAAAVAEQIAALRLAGGVIRLTPSQGELAALRHALAGEPQPLSAVLLRLARLCARADESSVHA
jgi:hypothetical protein